VNSLAFLVLRSLKNSLAELPRRPGKLVLYILALLLLGMSLLSHAKRHSMGSLFLDIIWLKGGFFVFLALNADSLLRRGLSTGDAVFAMSDVNLLFVSPLEPRIILVYGWARMLKMVVYTAAFILFESGVVALFFGLGFDAALLMLLGGVLATLTLIFLSFAIFSFSGGKPRRKRLTRLIAPAAFLPLAARAVLGFLETGDPGRALALALDSPVFAWTPVAGWAAEGTVALIQGDLGRGLFFLALLPLAGVPLVLYAVFSRPDYYEDVTAAAELSFASKQAAARGQLAAAPAASPDSPAAAAAKTGLGGFGAATFLYKHLRESSRETRLGFWGSLSLLWIAIAAAAAFFLRNDENGALWILELLMTTQIARVGVGRGIRELYSPYIYLIPESPFAKILWSSLEQLLKTLAETLVIFPAAALIMGIPPLVVAEGALVYLFFSLLLMGVNLLSLRWTGANLYAGLLFVLYVFAALFFMLPGLIGAAVVGIFLGAPAALGVLAVWELLAALGCFALSRDIVRRCDMPVLRLSV
jgi:hypothetical protein